MIEEALLDESVETEVMSDRGASSGEPDDETAADISDIGVILDAAEWEAGADDSEVQASFDVLSRKAIADGSDILKGMEEGKESWLRVGG